MLCLSSLYEHYQVSKIFYHLTIVHYKTLIRSVFILQEWEEAVTQALTYIWNNVFKNSEKDKEKLAPVTEQGILSHINLKRFLKQLKLVLDNMFSEIIDDDAEKDSEKVIRIQEFVEVI